MQKQVFINLAVKDVNKSMGLYEAMGFANNPQFSDDSSKCMVWSDSIFVMLLNPEKFGGFANKPLADTKSNIGALYALSMESLDSVNSLVENATAAGGVESIPMVDYGFMQKRNVEDFDGHTWEIFYMDLSKFPG